jgi:hypothetical protein
MTVRTPERVIIRMEGRSSPVRDHRLSRLGPLRTNRPQDRSVTTHPASLRERPGPETPTKGPFQDRDAAERDVMDTDELVAELLVLIRAYADGGELLDTWIPAASIIHLLELHADDDAS